MNKKTISSYIAEVKGLIMDGKMVQAYQRLDFLHAQVNNDVKGGKAVQ